MPLARFNYRWNLAFLSSALRAPTVSLYSSWVTFPCFHLLHATFLHLILVRSSLYYVLVLSEAPCKLMATCACIPACQDELFLNLKPGVVILQFVLFPPLRILKSTIVATEAVPDLQTHKKTVELSKTWQAHAAPPVKERLKCWYKWPICKKRPKVFHSYCKIMFLLLYQSQDAITLVTH